MRSNCKNFAVTRCLLCNVVLRFTVCLFFALIAQPVVSLSAPSPDPALRVSPTSLSFTGSVNGSNPARKTVRISKIGRGTLSWRVRERASWLRVSPTSGRNSRTISVSANLRGLKPGTYRTAITIQVPGASSKTRTIPVRLTVSKSKTPAIRISPTSLAFSATLTWRANKEKDLAGYKIYRATASGAYGAPIATVPKTATSYIANHLENRTTYFFVITAFDIAGNESGYSNEVSKSIF